MSLLHIGILCQIIGFLFAALGGGILLNRDIAGRLVDRVNDLSIKARDSLNKQFLTVSNLMQSEVFSSKVGASVLILIFMTAIVFGLLKDINWLFWLGLALLSPYLLISAIQSFVISRNMLNGRGIWLYPLVLLWGLFMGILIGAPAMALFIIFSYILLIATLLFNLLVGRDIVRKQLIIVGSLIVITGLILQYIAI